MGPSGPHGDVHRAAPRVRHPPPGRRGDPGQRRAWAAPREGKRLSLSLDATSVTDEEHPTEGGDEPAVVDPPVDLAMREAEVEELRARNEPEVPLRPSRDLVSVGS